MSPQATPERPIYTIRPQPNTQAFFLIEVDEGWRSSIMCTDMYEWSARWLVDMLQGKPYAEGYRP